MFRSRLASERGQAALEAAMVMPLMVFLALGTLQLALMHQASLMTEYAAYQAARAGIVWNGHQERMQDAALVALLPTMGATNDLTSVAKTYAKAQLTNLAFSAQAWGGDGPVSINDVPMTGQVRVDVVSPAAFPHLQNAWNVRGGADWKELEFDAPGTYGEGAGTRHTDRFDDPSRGDVSEDFYRRANVLSIRLRYWYELRIPFANWVIFVAWFASNADVALSGAIDRPNTTGGNMMSSSSDLSSLPTAAKGISHQKGLATVTRSEMRMLWRMSRGAVPLPPGRGRRYFIPLVATHAMRMQSNFHRKWVVHEAPTWEP